MQYNFDEKIDRYTGLSRKWLKYPDKDVIPLWIADMDFKTAPEIMDAMQQALNHGVFGYDSLQRVVTENLIEYFKANYNWQTNVQEYLFTPGLVAGINLACRALTAPDESILTATPIYPPFMSAPKYANRNLVTLPLIQQDDNWAWDFVRLEELLAYSKINIKLLLLCNPHNPVGRMWSHDELIKLHILAKKYDLWVCSDEIHCELILQNGAKHIPFASLNDDANMRTFTLMAQSKTYNLAGLDCAYSIAANPEIRKRVQAITTGLFFSPNVFGLTATNTAILQGEAWRLQLLDYLRANRDLVYETINQLDGFKMILPEATYLAWINGREFAKKHNISNLYKFFEQHGVGLSDGSDFAADGFVRLNYATTREILLEALERMKVAVSSD